jgi:hypothetical protein
MPTLRILTLGALATAFAPAAHAGPCDYLIEGAKNLSGQGVVDGYKQLLACDKESAKRGYNEYLKRATDLEVLIPLAKTAIDAEVWNPVWETIGKISDYEARDEVASSIGGYCAEDPVVVGFLKGAYFALKDIEFSQWDDALATCESSDFEGWLSENLTNPPQSTYNEKWNTLGRAQIARRGVGALEDLKTAAIAAGNNDGPFESALTLMEESIAQDFGDPTAEDQAALEAALLAVAAEVPPEQAKMIADKLINLGHEDKAASLLPRIYPDRVQSGGGFLYAAVSVEDCADDKKAYIHAALISEPGERYIVHADTQMRAFKARGKCDAASPWPVEVSIEPLKKASELDGFLADHVAAWEGKGYEVKTRSEGEVGL